jgi:hypothetical protein
MKVVCVNHDLFDVYDIPYGPNDPQIGDICTVVNECFGENDGGVVTPCYELAGYDGWVYDQRDFAPLSDLDETELVTEEFEEKYCVPVNDFPCV